MNNLKGKTIFITGASRGIGREIALKCAKDGANIVIAAKSTEPHPKLPGTIHTVAQEVIAAGGQALAIKLDVRDQQNFADALKQAADTFGGIDAVINNAGAIRLTCAEETEIKRFDLIYQINTRAVLLGSQLALPYLKDSKNAHIINLSPPLNLDPKWLKPYIPYTITKYGMSLLTLGLAEEFREYNIAVNSLWPKTTIATAAVEFEVGEEILANSRTPAIMADAAYEMLTSNSSDFTGQLLLDETILRDKGVTDFTDYQHDPHCTELHKDLYVD
ncbi:NAD(P)-dependent oxidoreductase [Thalassotalea psychrophila]|uniref:NAD(P)-dependent oxidoreductase n=1 Tax=Thalassotalea psychrophila TaxID=3065647 RepID=A0ABY9TZI7_9GAMM|nr:NAD(P)-dependent oxidoreductase [Colwelliaceae bacterium SQ149]